VTRDALAFEDSLGHGAQFVAKDEGPYVECYCDWCGDTETGFGAEVGHELTRGQAEELYKFLGRWLKAKG